MNGAKTPLGESSGDDQLARRIVSVQAGSGSSGPGLARAAAPPLFVRIVAPGRITAPLHWHRAE